MECYIKREEYWVWNGTERVRMEDIFKGFPIVSESQRKTAEGWAGTMKAIQIPEELENCGVDDFDDRMNNKIFKVYYMANYAGKKIKLYFDMYVPAMLDLMRNGIIDHEIIKTPLLFIDRARLVVKDGELHKEYIEKEAKKKALKETKTISTKDLKLGSCYSKTEDGQKFIYVGPVKGQGHLIINTGWNDKELKDPVYYSPHIKITTSLGFKFEHADEAVSVNDLKEYIVKKRKVIQEQIDDAIKINEQRKQEAKERAQREQWGWGWEHYFSPYSIPEYKETFELIDYLEKLLSTVDKQVVLV